MFAAPVTGGLVFKAHRFLYHSTLGPPLYIACAPRRLTRRILELRVVPSGKVLDLRTTSSQNCEAVPRRARV